MGIQGLIPFLNKASCKVNISQYRDCCVAVDAYCWLHKGAYTCAEKLARGEECDAYVFYCLKYVNMLLSHNIKPILVFDGRHLPAKANTERKRRESREVNRKTAADLLNAGRTDEARNYLRRCLDVTHAMALALIKECRKMNVDCIVAPYEADAQLAYLNLQNIAQIVITEDSDLVLFGCSKIMFKLDLQGNGLLVEHERLHLSMGVRAENFSFESFRRMCILSGCDYLPSLPGIGLSKALKFMKKTKDPDICRALGRIPDYLNMRQLKVPKEYCNAFVAAEATFQYQPVFDPCTRSVVPLTSPPKGAELPTIVDEQFSQSTAFNLALGNLDPFSLKPVDDFNPDCFQKGTTSLQRRIWGHSSASSHPSIWSRDFRGLQTASTLSQSINHESSTGILDVTPLGVPKQTAISETVAASPRTLVPSQADLKSMYGRRESEPTSICSFPRESTPALLEEESFLRSPKSSIDSSDERQPPPSPVLSQHKSRNPFAKSKEVYTCGLSLMGSMKQPNYFSALRKFDGVYPMKGHTDVIVVSRYFRSDGFNLKELESLEKSGEILKDMSNTDTHSSMQISPIDGVMLAEYTNGKENSHHYSYPEQESVLDELENVQRKKASPEHSQKISIAEDKQKDQSVLCEQQVILEDDISVNNTPLKTMVPSFNWSQFTCKKSISSSKLTASEAVHQTYKNPFRKKCILPLGKEFGETNRTDPNTSNTVAAVPNKSYDVEELPLVKALERLPEGSLSNDEPESSFQTSSSVDTSPASFPVSCGGGECFQERAIASAMEVELGPSEDTLWLQHQSAHAGEEILLSSGSSDSGFQDSQGIPLDEHIYKPALYDNTRIGKTNSPHPSTKGQVISTGRRLGLGRSSKPSQVLPKQNLLAQYGFSKRRKLAH